MTYVLGTQNIQKLVISIIESDLYINKRIKPSQENMLGLKKAHILSNM